MKKPDKRGVRSVTVFVDTREKFPIQFPSFIPWYYGNNGVPMLLPIRVRKKTLHAGDYTLKGWEDTIRIERKASVQELAKNFMSDDWPRQRRALEKLRDACKYRILLCDGGMGDFTRYIYSEKFKKTYTMPDPSAVMDQMMQACAFYRLQLWMVGGARTSSTRTRLGGMLVSLMLAYGLGRRWADRDARLRAEAELAQAHLDRNEKNKDFLEIRRARTTILKQERDRNKLGGFSGH